jgi:hypothetical protein
MTAWSYSALTQFETCPLQYYLMKVTKQAPFRETSEMRHGKLVHRALELRVGDAQPLPPTMQTYEPLAAKIAGKPGPKHVELKWAISDSFKPTTYFASNVWCRVVADVTVLNTSGTKLFVGDWKTGKVKEDSKQLALSAAVGMAHFTQVESVTTAFIWLQTGGVTPATFTRESIPEIWNEFIPRVARLEAAFKTDRWPAKPSGLCKRYCGVGRALCGHCGE